MADPVAVRFVGVSKRFPLGQHHDRTMLDLVKRLMGKRPYKDFFWPLRDVSFELPRGKTIGIVGENGSGKSTILKLITKILEPTSGTVEVNGRVAALLELGAGFHPELTGRDNIYLNGAVLGLARKEIDAVFDRIVDFSELGPFINLPVKNYSSGMYARLGFSVALHVDPDILLIDEVLAVGDENFQRRCLDAIRRFKARNKTIVIVSHNLTQMREMCDYGLWLNDSSIEATGAMDAVTHAYLNAARKADAQRLLKQGGPPARGATAEDDESGPLEMPPAPPRRWGRGPIAITHVQMRNADGAATWSFDPLEPAVIEIHYRASRPVAEPVFSVLIHKPDGHYLWASNTCDHPVPAILAAGPGVLRVEVSGLCLTQGHYYLSAAAYAFPDAPHWRTPSDFHEWLYEFEITSERDVHGDVVMPSRWQHVPPTRSLGPDHSPETVLAQD